MELSSHSLDQRRAETLTFEAGVFTNLTRDHLDYHETMEAYLEAKARLVSLLGARGAAIVNLDDEHWQRLPPRTHGDHLRARSGGDGARGGGALPSARERVAARGATISAMRCSCR